MSLFDCDQLIGWTSSINAELAPLHGRTLPLTEKKNALNSIFISKILMEKNCRGAHR